jgi:hypothetical protein
VYRAYRVSAHDGQRLARASEYLSRFPKGRFENEVRAAFEVDEPAFFLRAVRSKDGTLEYLTFLPSGPHAAEARAFLDDFYRREAERPVDTMVARAQRTESRMGEIADARKRAAEAMLDALGVLIGRGVVGSTQEATRGTPVLYGGHRTWGLGPREEGTYVFSVPVGDRFPSRELAVAVDYMEDKRGIIESATLHGPNMFLRWCEAARILALDPRNVEDVLEANLFVTDLLSGALEASFPRARCERKPTDPRALMHRECDGRRVMVLSGSTDPPPTRNGRDDEIRVSLTR